MAHKADVTKRMALEVVQERDILDRVRSTAAANRPDVVVFGIPAQSDDAWKVDTPGVASRLTDVASHLPEGSEVVLYGDLRTLPRVHSALPSWLNYHLCVAARTSIAESATGLLPHEHKGLIFYGKRTRDFKHARVRIAYTYCPACGKTTKDYGGRKHLYDAYGTLMSDVWKDFEVPRSEVLPGLVLDRVCDLLSIGNRRLMLAATVAGVPSQEAAHGPETRLAGAQSPSRCTVGAVHAEYLQEGTLLYGDALDALAMLPSDSVDLAFADPPYNLSKQYTSYRDNVDLELYFDWCDRWLAEYLRVLRPGGTLAVLNIPLWAIRHAAYLDEHAQMCNWVVWEAMSMPVREIMPSHYALLLYRKDVEQSRIAETRRLYPCQPSFDPSEDLRALNFEYCRRASCVGRRDPAASTRTLTDFWTDIDRLKHNSLRWDHPCQLPPRLMRRLIASTTQPGDLVLDVFNGVGTTTLAAQQLDRRFIGAEICETYHRTAVERHRMLTNGDDPFAKRTVPPDVKNNRVRRQGLERYAVPKKTLQLAVKALAERLGRLPTKEDVADNLPYPISYFERYFKSWSEVLAAARTTGMSEMPPQPTEKQVSLPL